MARTGTVEEAESSDESPKADSGEPSVREVKPQEKGDDTESEESGSFANLASLAGALKMGKNIEEIDIKGAPDVDLNESVLEARKNRLENLKQPIAVEATETAEPQELQEPSDFRLLESFRSHYVQDASEGLEDSETIQRADESKQEASTVAVSYTHLTLPTNREV